MQDTIEINGKELLLALLRKSVWIILTALLGGALAFAVTRYVMVPQYTSSVSLYVNSAAQSGQAAALNLNDLNASQKLVNTYIVILQDDQVMEQLAARLLEEYPQKLLEEMLPFSQTPQGRVLLPATLRGLLNMHAVNNTEVLRIEAETAHPLLSARICAIMTELAPQVLQRVVKAGSVEVIGEAKPAQVPSSPNLAFHLLVGVLAGGCLSSLFFLVRFFSDTSIKAEEDFKRRFPLPLLGEIPDFGAGKGRRGTYGK